MAEIGLAASILSVAALGASVARTIYEKTDITKNAHRQIRDLGKHVTHSTAVLKHMGQVFDTEKANCSKEIVRDIRNVKHSCKRTFRDIKAIARPRHFQSLRWLFLKSKAMELETRLDSQQSILHSMIHALTVSKLGRMESRYAHI